MKNSKMYLFFEIMKNKSFRRDLITNFSSDINKIYLINLALNLRQQFSLQRFKKSLSKTSETKNKKMNNILQDDQYISYLCESRSTEDICHEDTRQVFDFYISYTDFQISQRKNSLTESTQASSEFIFDFEGERPINAEIDQQNQENDFFVGQSYQNQLSKNSSIEFLVRTPSLQNSQKIPTNPFFDDVEQVPTPIIEIQELQSQKISFQIPCEDQVSFLFDDNTDYKPKNKWKKAKRTNDKRGSKGIRKSKKIQSQTQKFLKYMTHFHFSKNFKQFFKKGIVNHQFDPKQFPKYDVDKKIEVIDLIIGKEVQDYEMKMHYSVQKGNFLKGFGKNQTFIEDFFHQLVRRVYLMMFQTCKRRMLYPEDIESTQGYLDKEGEKQFNEAFEDVLQTRPYYAQLVNCEFERRLWKEIDG